MSRDDRSRPTDDAAEDPPPLSATPGFWDHYQNVYEDRPEGYDGTCLRPLGRCEMGGCCDLCWHNPDHPRFADKRPRE